MLTRYFKSMGRMMHEYANGVDDSPVERPLPKNKGIGNSTTLPKDATDIMTLKKVVKKLSFMVGIRLREEEKYATVTWLSMNRATVSLPCRWMPSRYPIISTGKDWMTNRSKYSLPADSFPSTTYSAKTIRCFPASLSSIRE